MGAGIPGVLRAIIGTYRVFSDCMIAGKNLSNSRKVEISTRCSFWIYFKEFNAAICFVKANLSNDLVNRTELIHCVFGSVVDSVNLNKDCHCDQ